MEMTEDSEAPEPGKEEEAESSPSKTRSGTSLGAVAAIAIVVLLVGLGLGYETHALLSPPTTKATRPGAFNLTLVEIMGAEWNSSSTQAKYYLVGDHGQLENSGNLSVPAKTLIQLTIVSYDGPTPISAQNVSRDTVVRGTLGNTMYLINGTMASMGGNPMPWGTQVTSVPAASIAHTFTIQQLGLNIPVVGGDTMFAQFHLNQTGTFTWNCMPPCGTGSTGWGGTMSTPGWMMGSITVS